MYAIVEIAGQQFKVEEGRKIFVHRLEAEEGKNLEFDRVLLIEAGDKVIIGEPVITDFIVKGKVLDHVRGDKVIIFKKKRKKGYRVKNGHRQNFTQVEIVSIGKKGADKKTVSEKSEVKAVKPEIAEEPLKVEKSDTGKPASKKAGQKKEVKAEGLTKKPAAKKAGEKKPAAGKKPAARKSAKTEE